MEKKLIFTALGAFGFGTLVSWAITTDIYERQFKQQEEMLDDLRQRVDNAVARQKASETLESIAIKELDVNLDQISMDDIEIPESTQEENGVVPEGETPEETRTNLQQLIDAYTANPDAQQDFADMATRSIEVDNAPPFVIPKATYAWDDVGEHYAKVTLTYFPRDRVLLDDDEDPIEDIASTVGWRNLNQFGGESEDPDVVFIRNHRLETDFEVIKEDERQLPLHVQYGMDKEVFQANKAAGQIKLRQEDDDN